MRTIERRIRARTGEQRHPMPARRQGTRQPPHMRLEAAGKRLPDREKARGEQRDTQRRPAHDSARRRRRIHNGPCISGDRHPPGTVGPSTGTGPRSRTRSSSSNSEGHRTVTSDAEATRIICTPSRRRNAVVTFSTPTYTPERNVASDGAEPLPACDHKPSASRRVPETESAQTGAPSDALAVPGIRDRLRGER